MAYKEGREGSHDTPATLLVSGWMAVTQPRRTKTNPDGACRECRTERAILKSGKTNIRPGGQKDAKLVIGYQNLFGNFFFCSFFEILNFLFFY